MAKRRQKRQPPNGNEQAGCISGLISIFDFRHGRTTRKLLLDRKGKKHSKGAECSQAEVVLSHSLKREDSEDGEERPASVHSGRTSVKKLMEKEIFKEERLQMLRITSEEEANTRENSQSRNKTCKTVDDIDISDLDPMTNLVSEESFHQGNDQKILQSSNHEILLQDLRQVLEKSCSSVLNTENNYDMHSDETLKSDKEKLTILIKVFLDQSLHNTRFKEDGQFQQSSEFVRALQKICSHKELLEFLQDPNSPSANRIEGLGETMREKDLSFHSLCQFGSLKEKPIQSKTDEVVYQKRRKFFRRSKSQESFPVSGNEKCQSSSKIVILKPGPGPAALQESDSEIDVGSSEQFLSPRINRIEGERSHFSFTEIKRKLKHAIRKEKQVISPSGSTENLRKEKQKVCEFNKGVGGENIEWRSPNRNHFFTERYTRTFVRLKKREPTENLNYNESLTASSDTSKPGVSDIYVEAKKHLLELIGTEGNNNAQKNCGQLPESLGELLTSAEFNFSPPCSPCKERNVGSANDQMRSLDQMTEEGIDCLPSPSRQCSSNQSSLNHDISSEEVKVSEAAEDTLSDFGRGDLAGVTISSGSDFIISEGIDHVLQKDNGNVISSAECNRFCSSGDAETDYAAEPSDKDMCLGQVITQSSVDSEILSSPSASPTHSCVPLEVENDEGTVDGTGRPSPVSVLDPLFAEDDISPARTISQPVDLGIQPREIDFNEEGSSNTCIRISSDDNETAFDYVEAVLLGSGLNWDEYLLRWLSSETSLDSGLCDEVELFSSKSRHEQRLLFDCTNEVLGEICRRYFGSFQGKSCARQNLYAVPNGMDLILDIWEGVERHLLWYPQSQSLDQLIKKDMSRSKTWMDLRLDIEHIGLEMEKAILDNLVEDMISSSICGTSESNFDPLSEDLTGSGSTTEADLVSQ